MRIFFLSSTPVSPFFISEYFSFLCLSILFWQVSVADGVRVSTATILIITQTSDKPLVSVSSIAYKVNPNSQLVLYGNVSLKVQGSSIWSTNVSNIDISAASKSQIVRNLPAGFTALSLNVNMMFYSPGSTLAFTLSSTGKLLFFFYFFLFSSPSISSFLSSHVSTLVLFALFSPSPVLSISFLRIPFLTQSSFLSLSCCYCFFIHLTFRLSLSLSLYIYIY